MWVINKTVLKVQVITTLDLDYFEQMLMIDYSIRNCDIGCSKSGYVLKKEEG